jgi:aryl-alcohol dehydrogenase-like predicted oxidoreductase
MWGMGGWSGSDDAESIASLELAASNGINFFDTAWAYGAGHSERLLGELVARRSDVRVFTATKVPPTTREWPTRPDMPLSDVYPSEYVREYVDKSRANLGVDTIDLFQAHLWEDSWLDSGELQHTVAELKRMGSIRAFGISINRWQPHNGIRAVRSGLVDSVQVVYNIFDQAPEDELFPACRENEVAVIARVPFDEGSLIGNLTSGSSWPTSDFRSTYFRTANLTQTLARIDALRPLVPVGMTLAQLALRFILSNPDVSTTIPGMRKPLHVVENAAQGDAGPLPAELLAALRAHRWDRDPASFGA